MRAFAGGVLSGIVEPVGAVLTVLAARFVAPALPPFFPAPLSLRHAVLFRIV